MLKKNVVIETDGGQTTEKNERKTFNHFIFQGLEIGVMKLWKVKTKLVCFVLMLSTMWFFI